MKKLIKTLLICSLMLWVLSVTALAGKWGDFKYGADYQGTGWVIESVDENAEGEIEIPSYINGYKVTGINSTAFIDCYKLTGIIVPDGIGDYSTENGILYNKDKTQLLCYPAGKEGEFFEIPNSVETIGRYAFYNNSKLTEIKIPQSVSAISEEAFGNCSKLKRVEVPKSVQRIDNFAFNGCMGIEELTIPFVGKERGNNQSKEALLGYIFCQESLYDRSGFYNVRQYYNNSNYVEYCIPDSLKKVTVTDEDVIPYGAFMGCNSITDIVIEGNPIAIMERAFAKFPNLINVTIKSADIKYALSNVFETSSLPVLHGYVGSSTEKYALKNDIEFEEILFAEEYGISGCAKSVNNKIIINVKVSDKVKDKHLHVVLYDENKIQTDYMIVPTYDAFDEINVVFNDHKTAKTAKIFLWESLTSLTPISSTFETEINR